MPKKTLFFILLTAALFSSSSVFSDWIDDYLSLHITVDCEAYAGLGSYYAAEVGNEKLYEWFIYEVEHISRGCDGRKKMTFDGTISYQDACSLLQVDPVEAIIIHNSLIEITRDPAFEGKVCSLSGLLH